MVNYLKAKSWSHYKIQSPRTTSGSSVIIHKFMPQSKALTITSVKSRSGEIRNCNCLGWSHQQHWWLDVDVASSYSHCDLALGLPGCRRQAAVANPCPTIDFIGLPLVPTAEGWPWWTWGGAPWARAENFVKKPPFIVNVTNLKLNGLNAFMWVSWSPSDPKKSQCIDKCIQIHQLCVNKHGYDIQIKFEVSLHFWPIWPTVCQ